MSERGTAQERYRRIHHAIETHPYLSGLMTNELQGDLSLLLATAGAEGFVPQVLTVHPFAEPGYHDIPAEDEEGWEAFHADPETYCEGHEL